MKPTVLILSSIFMFGPPRLGHMFEFMDASETVFTCVLLSIDQIEYTAGDGYCDYTLTVTNLMTKEDFINGQGT